MVEAIYLKESNLKIERKRTKLKKSYFNNKTETNLMLNLISERDNIFKDILNLLFNLPLICFV